MQAHDYMMMMVDPMAICAENTKIDYYCFLDKELTKLIHMNLLMVLYLLTIRLVHFVVE